MKCFRNSRYKSDVNHIISDLNFKLPFKGGSLSVTVPLSLKLILRSRLTCA